MEDRVNEYIRHYKKETQQLKEETTKKKKHLTYNEIKKIIESGSEIKKNENKNIASEPTPSKSTKRKGKKLFKKYNFDIT